MILVKYLKIDIRSKRASEKRELTLNLHSLDALQDDEIGELQLIQQEFSLTLK